MGGDDGVRDLAPGEITAVPLPVTALSPHVPSQSSRIWNAMPSSMPARRRSAAWRVSAPPMRAPASSAATDERSSLGACQVQVRGHGGVDLALEREVETLPLDDGDDGVVERRRRAQPGGRPVAPDSSARYAMACLPSPALIAWAVPHTAHTVGRWRRSRSPSWMSSWTRVKLWIHSTAVAAGSALAMSPPHCSPAQSARQPRTNLPGAAPAGPPLCVGPAEVVRGHRSDASSRSGRAGPKGVLDGREQAAQRYGNLVSGAPRAGLGGGFNVAEGYRHASSQWIPPDNDSRIVSSPRVVHKAAATSGCVRAGEGKIRRPRAQVVELVDTPA